VAQLNMHLIKFITIPIVDFLKKKSINVLYHNQN